MYSGRDESAFHLVKSFLDLKPNVSIYAFAFANDRKSYFAILLHPDNTLNASAVFVLQEVSR